MVPQEGFEPAAHALRNIRQTSERLISAYSASDHHSNGSVVLPVSLSEL
jgi:hypothetical protein